MATYGDKYHGGVPTDHWHKFHDPSIGYDAAVAAAVLGRMVTSWVYQTAASKSTTSASLVNSTGASSATSIKPALGDLIVTYSETTRSNTAPTAMTIADTSTGGAAWQPITVSGVTGGAVVLLQAWWKVANANDVNGSNGINVTTTATGGVGTQSGVIEVDIWRPPAGATVSLDLVATTSGSAATLTWSPLTGSISPSNTDALGITCRSLSAAATTTGTNTFTGTSSAANLTATGIGASNVHMVQYVGAVQASATAGTNVFVNTWTNSRPVAAIGVTFVYSTTTNITSSDTGSGADATGTNTLTGQGDTGAGLDAANLTVPTAETGAGADAAPLVRILVGEVGSGNDATATVSLQSAEVGGGVDAATFSAVVTTADTGTGLDAGTVSAQVATADAGGGADAVAVGATVAGADTGSGDDEQPLVVLSGPAEAGSGADVVTAQAFGTVELGTGADTELVNAAVADAEAGTGDDEAAPSATVTTTDTGVGVDFAPMPDAVVFATEVGAGADLVQLVAVSSSDAAQGADNAAVGSTVVTVADTGSGMDLGVVIAPPVTVSVTEAGTGADVAVVIMPRRGPYRWRAGPLQPRWSFGPLVRGTGGPGTAAIRAALALVGGDSH